MDFDDVAQVFRGMPTPSLESLRAVAKEALELANTDADGQWDLPGRLYAAHSTDLGATPSQDEPNTEKRLAALSVGEVTGENGEPFTVGGSGDIAQDLGMLAFLVMRDAVMDPVDKDHVRRDIVGYMIIVEAWGAKYDPDGRDMEIPPSEHPLRYELRTSVFMNNQRDWAAAVYERPDSVWHSDEYRGPEEFYTFDSSNEHSIDPSVPMPPASLTHLISALGALCGATRMATTVTGIKLLELEKGEQ